MDDAVRAKQLLIGASMKVKAFYGDNKSCAEEINRHFYEKNVEVHDIKTTVSNKEGYHGDILTIITYTEIK